MGIYPQKTVIRKDTCTPVFIAALFTMAETWKQPKCPLIDQWIKKMCVCMCGCVCIYVYIYIYTYTHIHTHTYTHKIQYYAAIKKNEIIPFATWTDLEIIILSEVGQKEKDKYHMISLICGI